MAMKTALSVIVLWTTFFVSLWHSISCGKCPGLGRTILTNLEGTITDGPGFYEENVHCEWLIVAPDPNMTITLTFTEFETECTYDFVSVFDGDSFASRKIGTFSGNRRPGPVTATTGKMLIHLYSDTNYRLNGTTATYKTQNCSDDCSGHGVCEGYVCRCDQGYRGEACQEMACPHECGNVQGRGECDVSPVRRCICNSGFTGDGCSLPTLTDAHWGDTLLVSSGLQTVFRERTGHTAAYHSPTDSLWVYGGYDLNDVLDDLVLYNFNSSQWEMVLPTTNARPSGRYGHSMVLYDGKLIVFGGVLANDSLSNQLWSFDIPSRAWSLLPAGDDDPKLIPPGLADHSGTIVNFSHFFVFGGRSRRLTFEDKIYKYDLILLSGWEVIKPLGGREDDVRVRGHSAVYHPDSQSLIVFGGFRPSSPRMTWRVNDVFAFHVEKRYWTKWSVSTMGDSLGRAFHSADIIGNYMVVYGGNVHQHYNNPANHSPSGYERCYDDKIGLFHLGCHQWVDFDVVATNFQSPSETEHVHAITRGRFGHATAVRDDSTLLVVGGYNGRPLRDLVAVRMPGTVAVNPETAGSLLDNCPRHPKKTQCLTDPNCGWCAADQACLGHSLDDRCSNSSSFELGTCPGICDSLTTCEACVIWGQEVTTRNSGSRVNEACGWCVQERRCYRIGKPDGACGGSPIPGWWGQSLFLTEFAQCRLEDEAPGVTWVKYRHPKNASQPDEVTIKPNTENKFTFTVSKEEKVLGGEYVAEYRGFLRPNGASPPGGDSQLRVWMMSSSANSTLYMSNDSNLLNEERVASYALLSPSQAEAVRSDGSPIIPGPDTALYFRQEAVRKGEVPEQILSVMELSWNGNLPPGPAYQPFTKEYLQPFYTASCSSSHYPTCSACLTDASCGWCPASGTCELRVGPKVSVERCGTTADILHHLVTDGDQCDDCTLYVDCLECVENPLCEWQLAGDDVTCTRRGRFINSTTDASQCSLNCNEYTNCQDCSKRTKECAWCEVTKTCFAFGTFITSFTYGQCPNWFDLNKPCPSCFVHADCQGCLGDYQCGWCGNTENPTLGVCREGNFGGLTANEGVACADLIAERYNISASEPADWSYERCPDVEECLLELHDCHGNATCVNTREAYECECIRGFQGDGRETCNKTCYHDCANGVCSGEPDYVCDCNLGWTADDCSVSCGCHNHSFCPLGVGVCDECQDWTSGPSCEVCLPGSHGNATDPLHGCRECQCSGQSNASLGHCDVATGVCYCTRNSRGDHCEDCVDGFYHDPRYPQHCSRQCTGRSLLPGATSSALGSGQALDLPSRNYCLWLLNSTDDGDETGTTPTITLTMEGMDVPCGRDYVYVYDGVPEYLSPSQHSSATVQLGAFCGREMLQRVSVVAHSGVMTIAYQVIAPSGSQGPGFANKYTGSGFAASYVVNRCPTGCDGPRRECTEGGCRCVDGYRGADCDVEVCPSNCSALAGRGVCDSDTGLCICSPGYDGNACQHPSTPRSDLRHAIWTALTGAGVADVGVAGTGVADEPCGRMGHTLVADRNNTIWLFGGYSHAHGNLNDVWSFNLSSKQWRQHFSDSSARPSPRRFHASTLLSNFLLVVGGMNDSAVMQDIWYFNTGNNNWSQIRDTAHPSLAGHSMTLVSNGRLVLIGGYSPANGLHSNVLEIIPDTGRWVAVQTTGSPPTGLFGHSTVWHAPSKALYVFGGYRFYIENVSVSDRLYSLTYGSRNKMWSVLTPEPNDQQLPHIFHAAVTNDDYMVVIGGQNPAHSFSSTLLVYDYECNDWIDLSDSIVGSPPPPSASPAAVLSPDGAAVYTFGGYDGTTLSSSLHRLVLPSDLCQLRTTVPGCLAQLGCAACTMANDTQELVFCRRNSNGGADLSRTCSGIYRLRIGTHCNDKRLEIRNCSRAKSCSECLTSQPAHSGSQQSCKWCFNCPEGACIPVSLLCVEEHFCQIAVQQDIVNSSDCPELSCEAADCDKCTAGGGCIWTRQFTRTGETRRVLNANPNYDWNCFNDQLLGIAPSHIPIASAPTDDCPRPCHIHGSCWECLEVDGADGGWQECVWSGRLKQCLSPTFVPLACAAGLCGPLTYGGTANCPAPCHYHTQCSVCLQRPGCGWCAIGDGNGTGVCMEGGLYVPTGGVCTDGEVSLTIGFFNGNLDLPLNPDQPPEWAFITCPPENECLNSHHDCRQNEDCHDTLTSYECTCKQGYRQQRFGGLCEPVCEPPCVYGICIKPDRCDCQFGFVGPDCGVACKCNGHSTCAGVNSTTTCLQCVNSTQGTLCENCLPSYVGNPTNRGSCLPCATHCHDHSDICLTAADYNRSLEMGLELDAESVAGSFPIGPVDDVICVGCLNSSAGQTCETCLDGYFLDDGNCRLCQCNGHWDRCDKLTGKDCQCSNNTDTPPCPTETYPAPCWQHQCSICEELFIGTPTEGHQCYREMHVEQDTCFDPKTQSNCPLDAVPLPQGRTSFFVLQPKFTNLDIRLTIDVTSGALDVYLTYSSLFFRIAVDAATGTHTVLLDEANLYGETHRTERNVGGREQRDVGAEGSPPSSSPPIYNMFSEIHAPSDRINTFVTITDTYFVTIVRGVENRLVVTLPERVHSLRTRKFYIILRSRGGGDRGNHNGTDRERANATSGIMYFRQDQPHIDLFVFFSVFLSCFFLFLAILVVAWKVKVGLEARNDRQRRALELEHRASRPIGRVLLYIDGVTFPVVAAAAAGAAVAAGGASSASGRRHVKVKKGWQEQHPGSTRPTSAGSRERSRRAMIATEPTEDEQAAIGTTIISLPGGSTAPVQACLGSSLIRSAARSADAQLTTRPMRHPSNSKTGMCRT